MRSEAEVRSALIHAIAGSMHCTDCHDIAAIRALAWVLELKVKEMANPPRRRKKKSITNDHFPA